MAELFGFETTLRILPFLGILILLMILEIVFPRRKNSGRKFRWPGNLGISLVNSIMLFSLPVSAVAASLISIEYKFGLFFWLDTSFWPKVIATLIILDLVVYWQHRLFHMAKWGWKIHRMHHSDTGFDVTTALRFHPLEIFISILIKGAAIVILGGPVFAVILFEIILNGLAMFNHSNIKIPKWLDGPVRMFIVTPDMHRVHHSIYKKEHDRNFGFCLSLWDRMFRSYTPRPADPYESMAIGLDVFNGKEDGRLDRLLLQPFR